MTLSFFVRQEITLELRGLIRSFLADSAASPEWLFGPPQLIDEVVVSSGNGGLDGAFESLGGKLTLLSARPNERQFRELDLRQLKAVEHLVEKLCHFSKVHALDFEIEFEGEVIGMIQRGVLDRSLEIGLLDEWRRHLAV